MEISETLAKAKGIANGDRVKVSSKRGFIRAVAVVTRRLQALNVHGQQVETVGIPLHWGFEGVAQKGYLANTLTPTSAIPTRKRRSTKRFWSTSRKRKERIHGNGNTGHY